MPESRAKAIWKTLAISGMSAMVIGLAAFSVDAATMGHFSFISDNYEVFLLAIAIGALLLLVSLVGWAAGLGKVGRKRIAFFTLTVPLAVILIAGIVGGTNAHGPFFLFLLPLAPLMLVGFVVAIMAANARRD